MSRRPSATRGWSWNKVIFALRERGHTVASVARAEGLSDKGGRQVSSRRWPRMQRAIARALGVTPQEIWPERYDDEGIPVRKQRTRIVDQPRRAA